VQEFSMKKVSRVILCGLMVLSVSVEAGKRRRTPCDRFFAAFSFFTLLFSPEAQAESLFCIDSQARILTPELHVAAFECDFSAVGRHLKEGHDPSQEVSNCYYFRRQGPPYNKPVYEQITRWDGKLDKITPKRLALTRGVLAGEDDGQRERCIETARILNTAMREKEQYLEGYKDL